ncbi:uncharacterized protein [Anabrus simplex]|uniref:uncharacterized protein isoform X2 n=1 Tax=Anabrus simplex TaxID=316456 RepID=UPI0035A2B145
MEEPVFVKCEPVRSSDTGEPSNFDNVHPMLGIIPLKQETKSELTESTQEYAFEENFQLLSEMKQETKSELIEPGTTQENAFEIISNHIMSKKCRDLRANWDESMMEEALRLLKKGKSQRYVESHCGIPRRTPRNHLKSGTSKRKLGTHSILTEEQEEDLEQRIIRFCEIGFPVTPVIMRRCVYKFVEKHNIKHPFSKVSQLAGREWFRAFMKRHPRLSKKKSPVYEPCRGSETESCNCE